MIEDLRAFCIIYIVTLWVILFNINSKSIQNWRQNSWSEMISLRCNFKVFELLFTYIHLSLGNFSALFKHKFLSFVNLSLFLHDVVVVWLEHFIFRPKLPRPALKVHYFGAKLAFIAGIFLKKYPWCIDIHFKFHFFAIWSISVSISSIIAWKALASGRSTSELVMFLKIDPQCFRPFGKFQDTKEISM